MSLSFYCTWKGFYTMTYLFSDFNNTIQPFLSWYPEIANFLHKSFLGDILHINYWQIVFFLEMLHPFLSLTEEGFILFLSFYTLTDQKNFANMFAISLVDSVWSHCWYYWHLDRFYIGKIIIWNRFPFDNYYSIFLNQ